MNTTIIINEDFKVEIDLSKPIDISIPLRNGENNPNCYWADPVKMEVIESGSAVGLGAFAFFGSTVFAAVAS